MLFRGYFEAIWGGWKGLFANQAQDILEEAWLPLKYALNQNEDLHSDSYPDSTSHNTQKTPEENAQPENPITQLPYKKPDKQNKNKSQHPAKIHEILPEEKKWKRKNHNDESLER